MDKKKLRVTLEVLDDVSIKYPETAYQREYEDVWNKLCFVFCLDDGCLCVMYACLWGLGWVDGLFFHAFVVLF